MGKVYDGIVERIRSFIETQRVFFVATAPLDESGHVNVSPKGLDSLRVLGSHEVAYVDYVGSGAETIAHLRENGRITIMFCAFEGPPNIVRLHGKGRVVEPGERGFKTLRRRFPATPEARCVVRVAVERVSDSCGYGVPLFSSPEDRQQLALWSERKGEKGLHEYQKNHNARSIDGLPALRWTTPD